MCIDYASFSFVSFDGVMLNKAPSIQNTTASTFLHASEGATVKTHAGLLLRGVKPHAAIDDSASGSQPRVAPPNIQVPPTSLYHQRSLLRARPGRGES